MKYSLKKVGLPGTLEGCTGMVPRLLHGRRSSDENLLGGIHLQDLKPNKCLPADMETLKSLRLYEYSEFTGKYLAIEQL
jgi:hypothetical protein